MNTPTPLQKRIAALSSIADPNKRFEALLADFERIESEKAAVESSLKTMTDLAVNKVTEAYPAVVQAAVDSALVDPNRKIDILARKYAEQINILDLPQNVEDYKPIDNSAAVEALKQANLEQTN
jgi:hypothetical protein